MVRANMRGSLSPFKAHRNMVVQIDLYPLHCPECSEWVLDSDDVIKLNESFYRGDKTQDL
jgi:hypothetical protein